MNSISGQDRNRVYNANDVLLLELTIIMATGVEVDLLGVMLKIDIYEDLYAGLLSGHLVVNDGINLIQHLPITGMEEIRFQYTTPGLDPPITKLFKVYRVGPRALVNNDRMQTYSIDFVSPLAFADQAVVVSQAYEGTIAEIAQDVYTDHLTSSGVPMVQLDSTTSTRHKFVFPAWRPIACLNWLANRAVSSTRAVNYLAWEDIDGFHFNSLDALAKRDANTPKITYLIPGGTTRVGGRERTFDVDCRTVFEWDVLETFTTLDWKRRGMFASTLTTHDITTKEIDVKAFRYDTDFARASRSHWEEFSFLASKDADTSSQQANRLFTMPKHQFLHNGIEANEQPEQWTQPRVSQLASSEALRVNIVVSGDSARRVGDRIRLDMPTLEPLQSKQQEWRDKYLSGDYMIAAIHHRFRPDGHIMDMQLVRDSIKSPFPDTKEIV